MQDTVPVLALQWDSWAPGGQAGMQGFMLVEFFPLVVNPDAPSPGGCSMSLHVVSLHAWGVHVVAHAQANDDHIKLIGERSSCACRLVIPDSCSAAVQSGGSLLSNRQRLG